VEGASVFRTSTTVQTFPPRRIVLPFYRNRELGWDIFNSFAGQLNAIEEKYQISPSGHDGTYERKGAPPGLSAKDCFLILTHSVGKIYQPLVIFF
jgi:hypothetical protein